MHQIRFRLGSLQRTPDPLTEFKGPTFNEKGEKREREGRGRKENGDRPPTIFGLNVALSYTNKTQPLKIPLYHRLSKIRVRS